jgi:hypothetical protein
MFHQVTGFEKVRSSLSSVLGMSEAKGKKEKEKESPTWSKNSHLHCLSNQITIRGKLSGIFHRKKKAFQDPMR